MKRFYDDNNFDYEKYKSAQIEKNIKKLQYTWIKPSEIKLIYKYLKSINPVFGIDHGARNNSFSKQMMEKFPELKVIGTDISPTIVEYGGIEWDMTVRNEEWVNKFDFVYTNSIDHCPNFEEAFNILYEQVSPGGVLFLHLDFDHENLDEADCTSIDRDFIFDYLKNHNLNYKIRQMWKHRPIICIRKQ